VYGIRFDKTGIYELDDINLHVKNNKAYRTSQRSALELFSIMVDNIEPNFNLVLFNGGVIHSTSEYYRYIRKEYIRRYKKMVKNRSITVIISYMTRLNIIKKISAGGYNSKICINPRYYFNGEFIGMNLIGIFNEDYWFSKRNISNTTVITEEMCKQMNIILK
jgi:hypothetical protein